MAAAAGGDALCVWDGELDDEPPTFRVGEVAGGVAFAGRHAGIGACGVIGVEGTSGDTGAPLTLWGETPELLDHPSIETLCVRVTPVIMFAFYLQASREALVWAENHYTLTRLWNRQGFFSQLRTPKAQRNCAVACIDIDDFRAVNESHGNAVGDGLLGEVANRLREIMRPGDVVARVSADEFAVLLTNVNTPEAVAAIGERIMGLFEAPFHLGGTSTEVGVTMGIAACLPERSGAKMSDAAERSTLEIKRETRGTWNVVSTPGHPTCCRGPPNLGRVDIEVRSEFVIPDSELSVRFTPSGGPGGQHANRSNTRVELSWRVEDSTVLSDSDRQLLLKILGPVVRIVVDDERSQLRNRDLAERRLGARVAAALVRPKRRRPTKPSRSSKRRRVEGKRQRGDLKRQRRQPRSDD